MMIQSKCLEIREFCIIAKNNKKYWGVKVKNFGELYVKKQPGNMST